MEESNKPGLIMCVCTGKCPGFVKMDISDFVNRARLELPIEYGFIHPQLCEQDGNRFLLTSYSQSESSLSPDVRPICRSS
jgi:hypothetical protein